MEIYIISTNGGTIIKIIKRSWADLLKEGKIGVFEATSLVIMAVGPEAMFSNVRNDLEFLGPAAWHVYILCTLFALAGFLILSKLMERFPGCDLVSVYKKVFGNLIGSILSLLVSVIFFLTSVWLIREFTEAVKVYVYRVTPPSLIMIFLILAIIVLLYGGLETISRTTALFIIPVLFGVFVIFVLNYPLFKTYNLFPILGYGMGRNLTFSIKNISFFGASLSLAVFLSSLQGNKFFKKCGLVGITIPGLFVATGYFVYTMVFPYTVAPENTIPVFNLTRAIEFGTFLQRFDPIFLFVWSISSIIAAAIYAYTFLSLYCKVFKINDHRPLVLPLGILLFCTGILITSLSTLSFVLVPPLRNFGGIVYFGLPLLALLVAMIRGQKGELSM